MTTHDDRSSKREPRQPIARPARVGIFFVALASTLGLGDGTLMRPTTKSQVTASLLLALARAQEQRPAQPKPSEPRENTYPFEMREKPWAFVIEWLSHQTNLPFVGTHKPAGAFTFIPPKGGPRDYTIPQIIDILNERLMVSHNEILIRRASSFTIAPYDQLISMSLLPRITLEELKTRGNTELACLLLPLKKLRAKDYAPKVEKMMGPQGRVHALQLSNHLHLLDHARALRRIVQTTTAIEENYGSAILDERINLHKGIDPWTPLAQALRQTFVPFKMQFEFDQAAFHKIGMKNIEETPIRAPKMIGVQRATLLHLLLSEAGAEFNAQGDRIIVVPIGQGRPYFPRETAVNTRRKWELQNKLAAKITLDKGIDANTPLKDALEFLSDRFDVTILIDCGDFRRRVGCEVETQPIKSPPQFDKPLATFLQFVLDQVNGTYEVQSDCILVVPRAKRLAPDRESP